MLDATLSVRDMATNVDIRRDAEKLRLVNTQSSGDQHALDATLSVRDMATNVDIRRDAEKLRLVKLC